VRPVNRANGHNYDDRSNKLIASYMHRIIKISLFLPRDAMQSAPYAMAQCLSGCLFAIHCIVSKWLNTSSNVSSPFW